MQQASAPAPFCIPRCWLAALFLIVGGLSCLDFQMPLLKAWFPDFYFSNLQPQLGVVGALILLAADRELGTGLTRRRILLFAGMLLGGLAWIYLMHDLADRSERRAMLALLVGNGGIWMWAAGLWLATPLLLGVREDRDTPGLSGGVTALLLLFTLELAAAAASMDAKRSIPAYFADRAALLPLLIGWLRAAGVDERLRQKTGRGIAWVLGLLMLAGAATVLLDRFGGASMRGALVQHGLIYTEIPGSTDAALPPRRLNFPMLHFNRTALLALIAIGVLMAAQFASPRPRPQGSRKLAWGLERWPAVLAALSLGVLVATYTRGMLLGALAGAGLAAALISRRILILIAVVACVGIALLPAHRRAHLTSPFRAATYVPAPGEPLTSMHLRLAAWRWAGGEIRQYPLTGIGYGSRLIHREYRAHVEQHGDARQQMDLKKGNEQRHMHNVWVELALESGLPAAGAFLIFCVWRWALLLRGLLRSAGRRRMQLAVWAGLEVGLMISGLVFYLLKQNFGVLQWMIWLWILVEVSRPARITVPAPAP